MANNIILLGLGPHAKRVYYPIMEKFGHQEDAEIIFGVDLEEKRSDIQSFLYSRDKKMEMYYLSPEEISYEYPKPKIEAMLNKIVEKNNVKGVIIATEPLAHMVYARWALKRGLHILMDKPVSTKENISTSIDKAREIINDYDELLNLYKHAKIANPNLTFLTNTQRRFHPGFQKIKELIIEVYQKTNCPVTSTHSLHSDGQWRMPEEIVGQHYHPYNQGYGKCSHSGYHSFDLIPWLMEAAEGEDKRIDNLDVFTNFSKPLDFLEKINLDDYRKYFKDFDAHNNFTQEQYNHLMSEYGEMDAFNSLAFKHGNKVITLSSINLLHNGVAQRNWVTAAGRDLYKGNGRIRQESHYITQGPFQSISCISYQSKEINRDQTENLYEIGGEYHFDIHVFRNDKMFPDWKNYEKYTIHDLGHNILEGYSRGHNEDARYIAVMEFLQHINGKDVSFTSEISTQWKPVLIMSAVYQSAIRRLNDESPLININFKPYLT